MSFTSLGKELSVGGKNKLSAGDWKVVMGRRHSSKLSELAMVSPGSYPEPLWLSASAKKQTTKVFLLIVQTGA